MIVENNTPYPIQYDLRSHILRSATECPSLSTSTNVLGKTKINLIRKGGGVVDQLC